MKHSESNTQMLDGDNGFISRKKNHIG